MNKEILEAKSVDDLRKNFEESSLSRVWKHASSKERPFSILTAFRNEYNRKQNILRNKKLASALRQAGYGYFWLDGFWIENEGTPDEIHVSEDSIFVIGDKNDKGRLKGLVKKLAFNKDNNQDAIVFKPEDEDMVYLVTKTGKEQKLGKFHPNRISTAYSKLRGKSDSTFFFESARIEKNWLGKLAQSKGM